MNIYFVGSRIKISTSTAFQNDEGAPFDPDNVTFKVLDPLKNETSYVYDQDGSQDDAITRNGIGDYEIEIDVDVNGVWYYRIEGEQDTGENCGADEDRFSVGAGKF